jgi:leucyl-tRNA synthetase
MDDVAYGLEHPVDLSDIAKNLQLIRRDLYLVLKQISYDYERMQYNTVVSGCMKMLNLIESAKFGLPVEDGKGNEMRSEKINAFAAESIGILLRVLYPVCPHIAHHLWAKLGYSEKQGDLLDAPWPQVDAAALVQDEIELVLQINGKLRGAVTVPSGATKEEIEALALASPTLIAFAAGAVPKKVIVVPGRLVNVVL